MSRRPTPMMLSVAQFAERCAVSTRTVTRWINSRQLYVHRIGRRVLIAEEDANNFLAKHRE